MRAHPGSAWTSPSGLQFRVSSAQPYALDDATIASTFRAQLPERVADLLDIAMEIHAADRLTTRTLRDPIGRGWCREIPVAIRVRDVDFWSSEEVAGALTGLLDWLSDDYWELCFLPFRGERSPAETQGTLFPFRPGHSAAVACFSGGLDSLGGAAIDLGEQDDLDLVLVGASGTSRSRALQRELAAALDVGTQRVWPLLIKANLIGAKGRAQDRHRRSRGLLFLSLAAATALVAEVNEVRVYENGIGSINLPYGQGQIGAHMARSAHPKTLFTMQRLVGLMDVGEVRFLLPRAFDTKADLTAGIPEKFADLIGRTVSCDTWSSDRQPAPPQGERIHRCGHCSSCVLRRQALRASGLVSLDTSERYRADAFALDATEKDAFPIRLMLNQVAELDSAINEERPWKALVKAFPQLVEARDALLDLGYSPGIEDDLVRMYRRYVDEWRRIDVPVVNRYLGESSQA